MHIVDTDKTDLFESQRMKIRMKMFRLTIGTRARLQPPYCQVSYEYQMTFRMIYNLSGFAEVRIFTLFLVMTSLSHNS